MISPTQRPLPDNTQQSQQTDIHAPGGLRTYNISRRAAVDRLDRDDTGIDRMAMDYWRAEEAHKPAAVSVTLFAHVST